MEKLKLHSPDLTQENIAKLAEMFPNCVTESKNEDGAVKRAIDFDQLRQELSTAIVEGPQERYQLNWPGKREALLTANAPIAKTLRPCREESVDFDTTQNLFIEGDNLDALKLLQETYLNKVKMIYIDPPYNTGNDFIYEDDFAEDTASYFERSNQKDVEGNRMVTNADSNGRFHSDWLSMMYSRLKLARNLLRDDGVIVISIDDSEQANLKRLCDEIFGEDNFIDTVIWKKRYGGGAKEKYLISVHEYALIYAKNEALLESIFIPLTEESIKRYYTQKDVNYGLRGAYRTHPLEATKSMGERQNLVFDIPAPDGTLIPPKRQWLWSKDRVEDAIEKNEIEFLRDKNGGWSVHTKQYLKDESGNIRQGKAFSLIDDIYTQHGTNEIINIFGNAQIFSFPKPTDFLKRLLQIGFNGNKEAIILDFFSGSAATAHAVMALNAEDGGQRKFIMVQIPEVCDEKSEASKAGYKTIAEIGKERIRRAGKKIKEELKAKAEGGRKKDEKNQELALGDSNSSFSLDPSSLDVGFRVLKIDSSNMKDVYYAPDAVQQGDLLAQVNNIREDRTPEDLLFQVLLDWGVDLALPITQETFKIKDEGGRLKDESPPLFSSFTLPPSSFKEYKVFFVDGNALAACFETGINEEFVKALATRHPVRAVFRDAGFGNDSVKINIEQIFKLISPTTELKSI